MAVNGVIGTWERTRFQSDVIAPGHPGPIRNMKAKADQGVLEKGLIVAYDANGLVVPYNPAEVAPLNTPIGVLAEELDTTKSDVAAVIVHGTVWREKLHVNGSAPSDTDLDKLEDIYIWPVG